MIAPLGVEGYALLGLVALVILWATGSQDVGGWPDGWTLALKMKHAVHFLIAAVLTFMAAHVGVPALAAAGVTTALGAGYELVERQHRDYLVRRYVRHDATARPGYFSLRDLACDGAGALAAAAFWLLAAWAVR